MTRLLVGIGLFVVMACGGTRATAQPAGNRPIITRLTSTGTLIWSNLVPYSACSVEWAGDLSGPWTNPAPQLRDILTGTNETLSAPVPVSNPAGFYRVELTPPFNVAWCRLQDDTPVYVVVSNEFSVAGRVRIPGLTDRTDGVDTNVLVRAQVGYRNTINGPNWFSGGTWSNAVPRAGWSATGAGEPGVDEYVGTLRILSAGDYYVAVRVSGDGGNTWLWGDLNRGPGMDGTEDGFYAPDTRRVRVMLPEFKVLAAVSASRTQVVVYFNQEIAPTSVSSSGSQFTCNNGLLVSSATVNGSSVMLTTSSQVTSQNYTVTVQNTVTDMVENPVSLLANTATFTGQ